MSQSMLHKDTCMYIHTHKYTKGASGIGGRGGAATAVRPAAAPGGAGRGLPPADGRRCKVAAIYGCSPRP